MKLVIYCDESDESELEALEVPVTEVENYISLIKNHGYEDSEGNQFDFDSAQVEHGNKLYIYVEPKGE